MNAYDWEIQMKREADEIAKRIKIVDAMRKYIELDPKSVPENPIR